MASSSSRSSLSLKIPTLYALTIQEPFATCIIHGPKRLENRTYDLDIQQLISASNSKTNDGIWIAIHVSQSKRNLGPKDSTCAIIKYQCWSDLPSIEVMKQNCGKIIGLAKFFNCVEAKDVPDDNVWKSMEDDDGTCKTKHYCWMIDDVKVLDNPIKSKGSSGIWKVDDLIFGMNQLLRKVGAWFNGNPENIRIQLFHSATWSVGAKIYAKNNHYNNPRFSRSNSMV